MKWIGQHIWSFISRFRSDVYLESLATTTETNVLVVDSAGKVSKSTSVGTSAASTTAAGIIEIAVTAEVTTGTDTTRAITPKGLNDGYEGTSNIETVGTVTSGTWRGTPIATGYIGDDQVTEDKLADTLLAEIDANTAKVSFPTGITYASEVLTVGDDDNGTAAITRKTHSDEAGGRLTVQGGDATGTNKTGGGLSLEAGRGTGSAVGGAIKFYSSAAGGSATTLRSNVEIAAFDNVGNLQIDGDLTVSGGDISGPTDGSLTIKAETDLIFQIDSDTGGTETFQFKNGAGTEVASLDESGNLQIDGDITISGLTIKNAEGEATFNIDNDQNTIFSGDIRILGGDIKNTAGTTLITLAASSTAVTLAGDLTISGGNITNAITFDSGLTGSLTGDASGSSGTVTSIGNLTGDVTSSNRATTIAADAVTYAKMQNVSATNVVLGRDSSGAGIVEEISAANLRGIINVADGATANSQELYVKILPSDFMPDDGGRPAMIDDTSGDRWLESHGTLKLFAFVEIPLGFKATECIIYGSATSAITVYEADVNSATVTSKGTGNIGTIIDGGDFTHVTADATNYIMIEMVQASGEKVYGGSMTIAAV